MEIYPLGHASFRLKGKNAVVITDPFDTKAVGLKFPKNMEADILTVSHEHPDHNAVEAVGGSPFIIRGPGEYEVKGVSIIGVKTFHDTVEGKERGANTVYHIEIDGVKLVHLGDLGHTLSSALVDLIGEVDVLFVPVGGHYSLEPAKAMEVVADLEPKIVIPMHYHRAELNPQVYSKLQPLSAFLKESGKDAGQPLPKLNVAKDKFPAEMQVVILE